MNRRTFCRRTLATLPILTTTAGCAGMLATHEQADANNLSHTIHDTLEGDSYTGRGSLEKGEYAALTVGSETGQTLTWNVKITSGDAIDVWVMKLDDFRAFGSREEFLYLRSLSKTGVTNSQATGRVSSGEHQIVFDNSAAYGSEPTGAVGFTFEIEQAFR